MKRRSQKRTIRTRAASEKIKPLPLWEGWNGWDEPAAGARLTPAERWIETCKLWQVYLMW